MGVFYAPGIAAGTGLLAFQLVSDLMSFPARRLNVLSAFAFGRNRFF